MELEKLDQKIYIFVINSIGFLKTLKEKGVQNHQTSEYSKLVNNFNKEFNNFYESEIKLDKIKQILISLLDEIIDILINNFEDSGNDVINEKADLYILSEEIRKDIKKL